MSSAAIGLDLLFDEALQNPGTPKPRPHYKPPQPPLNSEDADRKRPLKPTSKGASTAPAAADDPRAAAERMATITMAAMVLQRCFRKRLEVKPRLNRALLFERLKLESDMKVALLDIVILFLLMGTLYLQKAAEVDLGSLNDIRTTFENQFGLRDFKAQAALVSDAKNYMKTARRPPSVSLWQNPI